MRRAMVLLSFSCVALFLAWGGQPVQAQNFLMNSAETINKGNFKIAAFPTVLLGEDGADSNWGVGGRFGYGFTERFDMEAKLAVFDNLKIYGLDAEFWLLRDEVDVSTSIGLHRADVDGGFDSSAVDLSVLASGHLTPRLELYGGLNVSFESLDDVDDSDFTRTHLVPGIEYKISDNVDLLAEFGLGLNDDSPNYASFGLAFYLR
jgi:hypothetical protein